MKPASKPLIAALLKLYSNTTTHHCRVGSSKMEVSVADAKDTMEAGAPCMAGLVEEEGDISSTLAGRISLVGSSRTGSA